MGGWVKITLNGSFINKFPKNGHDSVQFSSAQSSFAQSDSTQQQQYKTQLINAGNTAWNKKSSLVSLITYCSR
jgi:hypothetical protein